MMAINLLIKCCPNCKPNVCNKYTCILLVFILFDVISSSTLHLSLWWPCLIMYICLQIKYFLMKRFWSFIIVCCLHLCVILFFSSSSQWNWNLLFIFLVLYVVEDMQWRNRHVLIMVWMGVGDNGWVCFIIYSFFNGIPPDFI